MARFQRTIDDVGDRSQVLLGYLDYFRATVTEKVDGLDDGDLRRSILPSGWSPLELVKHLVFMERRWLVWGFLGEQVDAPSGDNGPKERWQLTEDDSATRL